MQKPVTIDFETEAIQPRPEYPPKPVGVAIKYPGKKPQYYAWGHTSGNNCTKGQAIVALSKIWFDKLLLFHNGKFDLDVAETHLKLKLPAWDQIHDTLFLLFLDDPHATSLSLKPAAERLLKMPPDERDAVRDWLVKHGVIARNAKPGPYISKAPGDVVGPYACGDVERTAKLFDLLYPRIAKAKMLDAYDRERRLQPILLENEREGVRVELALLKHDLSVYEHALLQVDKWIRRRLKAPGLNLDADEDVANALHTSKVVEVFPKTPTGRDSISKKNLTEKFFSDRKVWLALYYRNALQTVLAMSMRPWAAQASQTNGYIFTEWNQVRQGHGNDKFKGARSGRVTCSRFQNISKTFMDRGDGYEHPSFLGVPTLPLVRKYLIPDPGHVWLHEDYNQQEMRLVAHYEDGALAKQYCTDPTTDVHTFVQQLIHKVCGKLYDRRPVKIVDFRTVYGGGKSGLSEQLQIPYSEASEIIDNWKRALPDVVSLDAALKSRFKEGRSLRTIGGRVYHCKPPAVAKKGPRKGQLINFEYTALNYLIQPSGADVTKAALIAYYNHPKRRGRLLVTVHDEINVSVPEKYWKAEAEVLRECMETIKLDVPWYTEVKVGPSWGTLEKP